MCVHLCFSIVVDVSAQSCTITSTSLGDLTGGVIANGTTNVMIECRCMEENGNPLRARWFNPDNVKVPRQQIVGPNDPYREQSDNIGSATLFIPIFSDSTSGVYTCGDNANYNAISTSVTINLQLGKD